MALANRVGHWQCGALLLAMAVACAVALAHPPNANAGYNAFCYANGNSILVGAQGYCVGNGYNSLNQVQWSLQNGDGVYHCAVSKYQSDGGGSNALQARCGYGQHVRSDCAVILNPPTYPKGTNESNSSHYYYGRAAYGGYCF